MRFILTTALFLGLCGSAFGYELTEEQKGPWNALEEQVRLGLKQDWNGEQEYLHPKRCLWGDELPAPVSKKAYSYWQKKSPTYGKIIAHHLVPVSVVVVGDVAIINFYAHAIVEKDEEQSEIIVRGHNTWKKEKGKWLLLANYNTMVKSGDEDD